MSPLSELCVIRRCRNPWSVKLHGFPLCEPHWQLHCEGHDLTMCDGEILPALRALKIYDPESKNWRF